MALDHIQGEDLVEIHPLRAATLSTALCNSMATLTQPQAIKIKLGGGVLFLIKHQQQAQSTCMPSSAAVGLALGLGSSFAADTLKQNLAHPLPPLQQKGDRRMARLQHCLWCSNIPDRMYSSHSKPSRDEQP